MWYNVVMKSSAFEFVVEWIDGMTIPRWETFRTRKEAAAKLREVAANRDNYGLKLVEVWTNAQAVDAK